MGSGQVSAEISTATRDETRRKGKERKEKGEGKEAKANGNEDENKQKLVEDKTGPRARKGAEEKRNGNYNNLGMTTIRTFTYTHSAILGWIHIQWRLESLEAQPR
jgi:hypothetical protein